MANLKMGIVPLSLLWLMISAVAIVSADSDEIGDEGEFDTETATSVPAAPSSSGRRNAQFNAACKKQVLFVASFGIQKNDENIYLSSAY